MIPLWRVHRCGQFAPGLLGLGWVKRQESWRSSQRLASKWAEECGFEDGATNFRYYAASLHRPCLLLEPVEKLRQKVNNYEGGVEGGREALGEQRLIIR